MFNTPARERDEEETSGTGSDDAAALERDGRYVRVVTTRDLASRRKLVQNLKEQLERRKALPPVRPVATHFQRFLYAMEVEMEDTASSMGESDCIAFMREVLQACIPAENFHLFNLSAKRERLYTKADFLEFCYKFLAQKDSVHISALATFEQRMWSKDESMEKYILDLHELGGMAHVEPRKFAARFTKNLTAHPRHGEAVMYFTTGTGARVLETIPKEFSFENLELAVLAVCDCKIYLDSLEEFDPIRSVAIVQPAAVMAVAPTTPAGDKGNGVPNREEKVNTPADKGDNKKQNRDMSQVVCYHCAQKGHYKHFCPTLTCTLCKVAGHIARVCPTKKQKKRQASEADMVDISKLNKKQKIALVAKLQGEQPSSAPVSDSVEIIPGMPIRVDGKIMALAHDLEQAQQVLNWQQLFKTQYPPKP